VWVGGLRLRASTEHSILQGPEPIGLECAVREHIHHYPQSPVAWLTPIARVSCFLIEQGGQGGTYCAHRASTLSTLFSNVPVCALCEQGPALTALPLLLECALREQAGHRGAIPAHRPAFFTEFTRSVTRCRTSGETSVNRTPMPGKNVY